MKKIVIGFIFLLHIVALDAAHIEEACDANGRTQLINFVITRQAEMDRKWDRIYNLWHQCFVYHNNWGKARIPFPVKTFDLLFGAEHEFKQFIADTCSSIDAMIQSGAQVNAVDHEDKSALDYAEYQEVSRCLRAHGGMNWVDRLMFKYKDGLQVVGCVALSFVTIGVVKYLKNVYEQSLSHQGILD